MCNICWNELARLHLTLTTWDRHYLSPTLERGDQVQGGCITCAKSNSPGNGRAKMWTRVIWKQGQGSSHNILSPLQVLWWKKCREMGSYLGARGMLKATWEKTTSMLKLVDNSDKCFPRGKHGERVRGLRYSWAEPAKEESSLPGQGSETPSRGDARARAGKLAWLSSPLG